MQQTVQLAIQHSGKYLFISLVTTIITHYPYHNDCDYHSYLYYNYCYLCRVLIICRGEHMLEVANSMTLDMASAAAGYYITKLTGRWVKGYNDEYTPTTINPSTYYLSIYT